MIIIERCPVKEKNSTVSTINVNYSELDKCFSNNEYNISKEKFENMVNENLKNAYSCKNEDMDYKSMYNICIDNDLDREETLEEIRAKTTVYPDPKECKNLYAKTKFGKKFRVYEVLYINDIKILLPVQYNKEGEKL